MEFAIRAAQGAIAQLPAVHCITNWVVHTQLVKYCVVSQLQFLTWGVPLLCQARLLPC